MTIGPQPIGTGPTGLGGGTNSAAREILFIGRSTAAAQDPVGLDNPLKVEFGPAQGGVNTPLQIDASGNITVNETGTYYLNITLQAGRSGAAGTSMLYGRLLVDGAQPLGSVLAELENSNVVIPLQFDLVIGLTAGQVVAIEIYRDSTGNNSGGLVRGIPTIGSWNNASSATITASRLIPASQAISASAPDRDNYFLVKQKSDLPSPVGGVITLAVDASYEINGLVDLGTDRISLNGSNYIYGQNPELDIIATSNATSMIEGRDAGGLFNRLSLSNTGGQIFDVSDITTPSTNSIFMTACVVVGSASVGTFNNLLIVQLEKCAFRSLSNGVSITGLSNTGVRFNGNIVEDTVNGTLINLGSSVCEAISLDHNFVEASAGLVFLDGLPSGGNVAASGQATVIANTTFGGNLPTINGVTTADLGWQFNLNNTIPNSDRIGSLYMSGNAIATTFSASATPTKVLGTTTAGATIQRFTMPLNNRLTYGDTKAFNGTITYSVSVKRVSGSGNRLVRFSVYKNGSPLAGAAQALEVDSRERSITITSNDIITNGDYYELWISNEENTNSMTVTDMNCSITGK